MTKELKWSSQVGTSDPNAALVYADLGTDNNIELPKQIREYTGGLVEVMPPTGPSHESETESEIVSASSTSDRASLRDWLELARKRKERQNRTLDVEDDIISIALSDSAASFGQWTVQPIHQTVKEFLRQHDQLQDHLMNDEFRKRPTHALENGDVYILKSCYWWLDIDIKDRDTMDKITSLDALTLDVLFHSPHVDGLMACNEFCELQIVELLDGLDMLVSRYDRELSERWPIRRNELMRSCFHVPYEEYFTFIAPAVISNMQSYVNYSFQNTRAILILMKMSSTKNLLYWALICLGHDLDKANNLAKSAMIERLINAGCLPDWIIYDESGRQHDALGVLMHSALSHDFALVAENFVRSCKILLDNGANANGIICSPSLKPGRRSPRLFDMAQPTFRWAPVSHVACTADLKDEQRFRLFEAFFDHGLDIKNEDSQEETLLESLFGNDIHMRTEMWLWLLQKGARVTRMLAKLLYTRPEFETYPLLHAECRKPEFYTWRAREVARKYNTDDPSWTTTSTVDVLRRVSDAIMPTGVGGGVRYLWSRSAGPAIDLIERKREDFRMGWHGDEDEGEDSARAKFGPT